MAIKGAFYQWVSNSEDSSLVQFDYPKSDESIGEITAGGAQGECTDATYGAGKTYFWVVESDVGSVDEYTYDGKGPVKTLNVTGGAGCAMDPKTGNLAVTILGSGDVVIFANAGGSGSEIRDGLLETYYDGYDDRGNLFADGFNEADEPALAELKNGSSAFTQLALSNSVGFPGGVQWDGKYITLDDQKTGEIYGYACHGYSCALEQTVVLSGSSDCTQTWIGYGNAFCPDAGAEDVEVYEYPAGGSPIAILTGPADLPIGAVQVSR